MGAIEAGARQKRRKRRLKEMLLMAAIGTGLTLIGGAPNPRQLLRYLKSRKDGRFNYQNKRALQRLKADGLVVFAKEGGRWYARTTDKGRMFLLSKGLKEFMDPGRKKRWDGRWRVIIFDISEKRRVARNRLRAYMGSFGFTKLQESVWVYPYECEEVLTLLKAELRIGNVVLYMVVEEIENDRHLREHFCLPSA